MQISRGSLCLVSGATASNRQRFIHSKLDCWIWGSMLYQTPTQWQRTREIEGSIRTDCDLWGGSQDLYQKWEAFSSTLILTIIAIHLCNYHNICPDQNRRASNQSTSETVSRNNYVWMFSGTTNSFSFIRQSKQLYSQSTYLSIYLAT